MATFKQADYAEFLQKVEAVVGKDYCLTDEKLTKRYRSGIRYGSGDTLAAIRPGSLVEYYKVVELCVQYDIIIISQAANTGLTGGSTPFGEYDRPNVVINTLRIDKFKFVNEQTQVVCLSGATLYRLEDELAKIGREPHSVIGSSCIGASVIGGVCNNSGGALVQRGPSFTEYACYARINEEGKFEFVNNLGLDFGDASPEEILAKLDALDFSDTNLDPNFVRLASSTDYKDKVVLVDEPTPARYNADPERLKEASGSAGHLAVFAVRLDTFAKPKRTQVFYIGTNDINTLTDVRRAVLTELSGLPISGEYIHRAAYDIGKKYGKDTTFVIDKLGTKHLPKLYALKDFYDRTFAKLPLLPTADQFLQWGSYFLPNILPKRMEEFRDLYEHHLILNTSDDLIEETNAWLENYFADSAHEGGFFKCTPREGKIAGLHRFSIAGAAIRYRACHPNEVDICAIDVALRRNDREWFEHLPESITEKLDGQLYYGHFLCHVFHQDYLVKKPHDALEVEHEILQTLYARGAEYPAEHNVGHLYEAKEALVNHYKNLDPTNSFNPGVGKTTKAKNWAGHCGCGCGHDHH